RPYYCVRHCEIADQFKLLGDRLLEISSRKAENILKKKKITPSDISYLIKRGYSMTSIAKRLKMNPYTIIKRLHEGSDVRNGRRSISKREQAYEMFDKEATLEEVIEELGVEEGTAKNYFYTYGKMKRNEQRI